MEIELPQKLKAEHPITVNARVLVVIGANGAGKSSFGRDLCQRYPDTCVRISGMHALFLNCDEKETDDSISYQLPRLQTMIAQRLAMPRLTDYEKLIVKLQGEEFEAAINFKEASRKNPGIIPPITKIDQIQTVWEKMFPHNRLVRRSGFIELTSTSRDSATYTAGRMSDGEKIVFYLTGAVLEAKPDSLLVIEEPEILLHESIKSQLWDEIENLRPDCSFVYLTHDIDFAMSRSGQRIWIRDYNAEASNWDYELLDKNDALPEEVYMEILGSRKPILFIEGDDSGSIDCRLYPLIFPEYTVKPMGGCQKVIETTKAFTQLKSFHMLESMGIVDRDRRTEGEIEYLRTQRIFVPGVAEVENLLMLEPVIRTVAHRLMKDPDEVFSQVKESVIRLFEKDLESQVLLHARHHVRKRLEIIVDKKINTAEELADHLKNLSEEVDALSICDQLRTEFAEYVKTSDYNSILRVYNQKGMLPQCRLCSLCGISNKENYLDLILSILKKDEADADVIRKAIKQQLNIEN